MGPGIVRVYFERASEADARLLLLLRVVVTHAIEAAQPAIIGLQIAHRLAAGMLQHDLVDTQRERAHHSGRDLVLDLEHAVEREIETAGPELAFGAGIDQLHPQPYRLARPAQRAAQQVMRAE